MRTPLGTTFIQKGKTYKYVAQENKDEGPCTGCAFSCAVDDNHPFGCFEAPPCMACFIEEGVDAVFVQVGEE